MKGQTRFEIQLRYEMLEWVLNQCEGPKHVLDVFRIVHSTILLEQDSHSFKCVV